MATWEDGPEYAPSERPAAFTSPAAEPLEPATPRSDPAAGAPVERPQFAGPATPVAPLASLVVPVQDTRDPAMPFAVVSSNLTSGSAWGSAHGGPPTPPAAPAPALLAGSDPYASLPAMPPAGAAFPSALAPATPSWPTAAVPGYPPALPGPYPAPGTPQWFGPSPYGEQAAPTRVDSRRVFEAATPALLIVLVIGSVVQVLSPLVVVAAFVLHRRVQVGQQQVRRVLTLAVAAVGFFAFVGLPRLPLDFGAWWSFVSGWALLVCWASLASTLLVVRAALKRSLAPPAPPANPWR